METHTHRRRLAIAGVAIAASLGAALLARSAGAGPWVIETADGTSGAGAYPSLRIDAAGQPHVSYGAPVLLRHAVRIGGTWSYEGTVPLVAVPVGVYAAEYSSPAGVQLVNIPETALALDPSGNPAIASANSGDSKYINFNHEIGGIWQPVEGIDPGYAGEMPAIAFDPLGRACVAYHAIGYQGVGDAGLFLSTRTGTGWAVDTVDATPQAGYWPSLAFDPNGDPCVLYDSGSTLEFARRSSGIWTIEPVDAAGQCAPGALAFDPSGDPHAVYQRGGIVHAVRHAGIWSAETVDANGTLASLALDRGGRAHTAYLRSTDGALRYGVEDSGLWSVETVGPRAFNNSIALAADGTPFIAYSDGPAAGGAMRVAIGTPTVGVAPGTGAADATFGPISPQPARVGEPLAIAMSLPRSQVVTLTAFDVTGRLLDPRPAAPASSGSSVVPWQPRLPGPGLYLIRMRGSSGASGVARLVTVR